MNDNEEDLDSTIRHAKALTWVCVALFVVLDVIGLTAPSQSDPRFVLNSTSRTMPGAMTGVSRRPSSLSP